MPLIGRVGVEPTQYLYRRILSPLRLPIPPPPRVCNILPLSQRFQANSFPPERVNFHAPIHLININTAGL